MEYKNSSAAIIGAVMFPEEKFHEKVGVFNTPGCPIDQRGILNPNTNKTNLEDVYGEAAGVLLQLSQSSLPRIGSLDQVDGFTWKVAISTFIQSHERSDSSRIPATVKVTKRRIRYSFVIV